MLDYLAAGGRARGAEPGSASEGLRHARAEEVCDDGSAAVPFFPAPGEVLSIGLRIQATGLDPNKVCLFVVFQCRGPYYCCIRFEIKARRHRTQHILNNTKNETHLLDRDLTGCWDYRRLMPGWVRLAISAFRP